MPFRGFLDNLSKNQRVPVIERIISARPPLSLGSFGVTRKAFPASGRGEVRLKALSFSGRHGTNSTWDPLASVTEKGEGKQWLRKPISALSTSMSRIAKRPKGSTWKSMRDWKQV